MSLRSPSAASQPPSLSSPSSSHPELAKRIERFQAAARDLLALYEPARQGPEGVRPPDPSADGETRCYYLSPGAARHERELLQQYHAEDFRDLLAEAHRLLVGLVKIMKTTPPEVRVRGYVVASLGCALEQASALVLRMKNVYDKVEFINMR